MKFCSRSAIRCIARLEPDIFSFQSASLRLVQRLLNPTRCAAKKPVRVAVGVILQNSKICISLRPEHLHKGGFWEFPGGKIEAGETAEAALARELYEELGIRVKTAESIMEIPWNYAGKTVLLEVMKVTSFAGEATGTEGQQLEWVTPDRLGDYRFPEANQAIVDYLVGTRGQKSVEPDPGTRQT